MNLFNKIAVIGDNHFDLGPAPPADPCHDVPVEGPHHLLYLLAQGRCIVVRGCTNTRLRDANQEIVPKACSLESHEARPPSLTPLGGSP